MVPTLLELGDLPATLMLARLEDLTVIAVSAQAKRVIRVVAEVAIGQTAMHAGSSVLIR